MRWYPLDRDHGFTLLEVVVAAAFTGVTVIAITGLFTAVDQINTESNNYTVATEVAQQIIEQYRNTPYNNITVGTVNDNSNLTPYPSLQSPRSATAVVATVDASGLKSVTATVTYTARTGLKTVELESIIASKGLDQ